MTTIAICTIGNAMSREQREALAEDMRVQLRSEVKPLVLTVPVGVKLEFAEVGHFGEAKTDHNRIVLVPFVHATEHQRIGAKTRESTDEIEVRYSNLTRDQKARTTPVWREVPAKTSIGELTVKLDTSLVRDAIREMLEPGAMYLPASAVEKLKRFGYVNVDKMVEFGGIAAEQAGEDTKTETL